MNYFIKQFAEFSTATSNIVEAAGTMTMTKSIEGADQDAQQGLLFSAFMLGTKTCTESTASAAQDRNSQYFCEG